MLRESNGGAAGESLWGDILANAEGCISAFTKAFGCQQYSTKVAESTEEIALSWYRWGLWGKRPFVNCCPLSLMWMVGQVSSVIALVVLGQFLHGITLHVNLRRQVWGWKLALGNSPYKAAWNYSQPPLHSQASHSFWDPGISTVSTPSSWLFPAMVSSLCNN